MIITRDQTFTVVCNIRTPIDSTTEKVGTGIFISKDNKAYLVTAEHVAKDTTSKSYIVYCDSSSNPVVRDLTVLNKSISWKYHTFADICCLEIDINANFDLLNGRCFPYDHIETDNNMISRDNELTCVGFPNGLGALGKFTPFTFRSYFSSNLIRLLRFDTKVPCDFLCLENPSVGGFSGGPIFDLGYQIVGAMTTTKDKTRLYGIMHGTISDDTGGKIAAVTPIYYLKDLI
jgi:hypothetical protein